MQLARSNNQEERPRPSSGTMKYAVGMVVEDKRNVSGVIISWDMSCKKSVEWMDMNGVRKLVRGPDQPFYVVFGIIDSSAGEYYVAEGNMFISN